MSTRGRFGLAVCAVAVVAIAAAVWFGLPPSGQLAQEDISSIRRAAIRSMLAYRQEGRTLASAFGPGTNLPFNVCFVGVTAIDADILDTEPSAPDMDFISRMPELGVSILPVSKMG
ncbi:MAG: hypothetical protein KJ579_01340, partial [Verrucomicrobia bacterium]|nr:hypothetical protein [Verrucomicrobiota bacterium]